VTAQEIRHSIKEATEKIGQSSDVASIQLGIEIAKMAYLGEIAAQLAELNMNAFRSTESLEKIRSAIYAGL
jgi:hypothetical protein